MKLACLFTFMLGVLLCSAQVSPLSPDKLVSAEKAKGTTFEKYSLLDTTLPAIEEIEALKQKVKDFKILKLNKDLFEDLFYGLPKAIILSLPDVSGNENIELELVKVDDLLSEGFVVRELPANKIVEHNTSLHYRGVVKGTKKSLVAISLFKNEISGIITSENTTGNLVLGKLGDSDDYLLYDDHGADLPTFDCGTLDKETGEVFPTDDYTITHEKSADNCINVYLEADHSIFQDKGSTENAVSYLTALFNQMAVLYANEAINMRVSEINVWTTPDPYAGAASNYLLFFLANTPTYNGDIAHYLTFDNIGGGIAYVGTLCTPYAYGVSGIQSTYNDVPVYSWSVMVMAHEIGHNLGSSHTHACTWNGNNTQIDDCGNMAATADESCYDADNTILPESGTIMSYCHLIWSIGINFNNGFGQQPGDLVRSRVYNANCLSECEIVEPPSCDLSDDWMNVDIGSVGIEGNACDDTGDLIIDGSGSDIGGTTDQCHFVYQQMAGDKTVVAYISDQSNPHANAKTGIMLRESLDPDSKYVMMALDNNANARFQCRTATASASENTNESMSSNQPMWVKIERMGDLFTGSISSDGMTWMEVADETFPMSANVFVGAAVTSYDNTELNTATVTDFSIEEPKITYYHEVECASVGGDWVTKTHVSASNSQYVVYPGAGIDYNSSAPTSVDQMVRFWFIGHDAGLYNLHIRLQTTNQRDNSLWVRADNGAWMFFNNIATSFGFKWRQSYDSNNGNQDIIISINGGLNVLDLAVAEDGLKIDKIALVPVGEAGPTAKGGTASNCQAIPQALGIDILQPEEVATTEELIDVFPNPFSNRLNISLPAYHDVEMIELIDVTGRVLYQEEIKENTRYTGFEVTEEITGASGLYFLKFRTPETIITKKLIRKLK